MSFEMEPEGLCLSCQSLAWQEWDWSRTTKALEERARRDPTFVLDDRTGRLKQAVCCFTKRTMPDVHALVSCPWYKVKGEA